VTVSSDGASIKLGGATRSSGVLAPSASLVSRAGYDGDVQLNVSVSGWAILQ
jgi:hypothetical protein